MYKMYRKFFFLLLFCFLSVYMYKLLFQDSALFIGTKEKFSFLENSISIKNQTRDKFESNNSVKVITNSTKRILIWNKYWGDWITPWKKIFKLMLTNECPVSDCQLASKDQLDPALADAILFHPLDMYPQFSVPTQRKYDQLWIFFSIEAPPVLLEGERSDILKKLNISFNWTMTYRTDSDINVPYGQFIPIKESSKKTEKNYWREKTRIGVWMVSHCSTDSRREDFMKELRKYLKVDVFGKCASSHCGERITIRTLDKLDNKECDQKIRKYYFYFALENSICVDYVTEKFYVALSLDVIPVVLGGADYPKIAPAHSFINALDFESPKHLAEYLTMVSSNETAYNQYFEWKNRFDVRLGHPFSALTCDLCAKLHGKSNDYPLLLNDSIGSTFSQKANGGYEDIHDWFVHRSKCKKWNFSERTQWIGISS